MPEQPPAQQPRTKAQPPTAQGKPVVKAPKPKLTWKQKTARAWRITKLVATLFVGGALGWVVASLQGEARLQRMQSDYEARLTTQRELTQPLEARLLALKARRAMHLSLIALEQRNFGTAERHAREAGEGLAAMGPGAERYAELADELQSFRPRVSDDISEQRAHLIEFSRQFDAIFDEEKP